MKNQKNIGLRIILVIAAITIGLAVQVVGAFIDKLVWIGISPELSYGLLGLMFILLGFVVMGYLVYRWALKTKGTSNHIEGRVQKPYRANILDEEIEEKVWELRHGRANYCPKCGTKLNEGECLCSNCEGHKQANIENIDFVDRVREEHDIELNELWDDVGKKSWDELVKVFYNELEREWSRELSEIISLKQNDRVTTWLNESIVMAYANGYMVAKTWISVEQLAVCNLALGDILAAKIKENLKGAKSRGIAFAHAFSSVALQGDVAVSNIVSKADVLEAMFHLPEVIRMGLQSSGKGFMGAEARIISYKVNPLSTRAFPVKLDADEDKFKEWLNDPRLNRLIPDFIIMGIASKTPMPVQTAERILRTLLEDKYENDYKVAEEKVKAGIKREW